ncbi:MAG: 2-hydroxychromene-2-carboxylate isomerase [Motiliproteus sp.]
MDARLLDFYFDYLSPYAYFSWRRLQSLCQQHSVTLRPHPVVFGKLLDHWGQRGPAEIAPKKASLYRYCYRYATLNGFVFDPPRCHPYNPLPSLRLSLPQVCGDRQIEVISALFDAGWTEGADLGSVDRLQAILDRAGFDGAAMLAAIETDAVKQQLRDETEQAIGHGVFGVPTFIVDQQLFWGNDQVDHLELYLQGDDPLDVDAVEAMLARPRGIDRKVMKDDNRRLQHKNVKR